MFYGEYCHTVDKKGRVIIPVKFREVFERLNKNRIIVTRGLEKSLFLFSLQEWRIQEEKFKSLPLDESSPRTLCRILFSGVYRCALDKQGRINLPQSLINYAEIKKDVVIVGVSNRIEIWDRAGWKDYVDKSKHSFIDITRGFIRTGNLDVVENR